MEGSPSCTWRYQEEIRSKGSHPANLNRSPSRITKELKWNLNRVKACIYKNRRDELQDHLDCENWRRFCQQRNPSHESQFTIMKHLVAEFLGPEHNVSVMVNC